MTLWSSYWKEVIALVMGIVEGLTEFAPVSSTGHMILVHELLLDRFSQEAIPETLMNTFTVVIQLGSILAIFAIFWRRLFRLIGIGKKTKQDRFSLLHLFFGVLPAVMLGCLYDDWIDQYLFTSKTVLIGLVLGGIFMIFADKWAQKKSPTTTSLDQLTYRQALGIGFIQCFALWPGFSRSGSTISGGILLGTDYRTASEFSFIVAFPIMIGASGLRLIKSWEYLNVEYAPMFIIGFIVAFLVALLTIRFFLRLIPHTRLSPFAYYRFALACFIVWIL